MKTTGNDPDKNSLATWTQVKTVHEQQNSYIQSRIQLWGTVSTSNLEFLECLHSKAWCVIVDAPWYVLNTVIPRDLQTPTAIEEIRQIQLSIQHLPQSTPKQPSSEPHGTTWQ
jgi:hypothetical protein